MLDLHLHCGEASVQEWMGLPTLAATGLSKLNSLLVDWFDEELKAWDGVLDAHLFNTILAHAHSLRVLQLGCHSPKILMPMGSLRHLILSVGKSEAVGCLSALASAHSMRTLLVASHEGQAHSCSQEISILDH